MYAPMYRVNSFYQIKWAWAFSILPIIKQHTVSDSAIDVYYFKHLVKILQLTEQNIAKEKE